VTWTGYIGVAVIGLAGLMSANDLDRIEEVVAGKEFTISIESKSLGYFQVKEWYHFDRADSVLRVTRESLVSNAQDSAFNKTPVRTEVLTRVVGVLKDLKAAEIKSPRKVSRRMFKNGPPDILELCSAKDTIVILDPERKCRGALTGILNEDKD
jgi:hypothetical protein